MEEPAKEWYFAVFYDKNGEVVEVRAADPTKPVKTVKDIEIHEKPFEVVSGIKPSFVVMNPKGSPCSYWSNGKYYCWSPCC